MNNLSDVEQRHIIDLVMRTDRRLRELTEQNEMLLALLHQHRAVNLQKRNTSVDKETAIRITAYVNDDEFHLHYRHPRDKRDDEFNLTMAIELSRVVHRRLSDFLRELRDRYAHTRTPEDAIAYMMSQCNKKLKDIPS